MEPLESAAGFATSFLGGLPARRVTPTPLEIESLAALGGPLPEQPTLPSEVIALLHEAGSPGAVATAGGRYFGFVNGSALPASLAATWLASAWNQNAALRVMSPVAATLEDISLEWARDLLGLPAGCAGALTTGATIANLSCLAAARHALLQRAGWDVGADGLFGAPPIQIVVGDEVHVSLLKALGLLGLGRKRVLRVPTDGQGRLCVDALPPLDERTILCLQAGNVNTGGFDPAGEACRRAHEAGAWVHVDGAFGLWAAASPRYRHLAAEFGRADSWATDGHKWPNTGYDCGLAFVRDAAAMRAALSITAAYLPPSELREPSHYTPDMSRRARGAELWAGLRSLGRAGIADLIDRTCLYAQQFALGLREAGYEVLNDVVINQVLVSFGSPEKTRDVVSRIQQEGVCWCGGTEWHGRTAMRISVSSWATTQTDVDLSLAAMIRAARA